jgi:hypothetical protein
MTYISSMRKIEDPPPYWKVLAVREKRWSWWFHYCYVVAHPSIGLNVTRSPTFPLLARLQHGGWHLWGQPVRPTKYKAAANALGPKIKKRTIPYIASGHPQTINLSCSPISKPAIAHKRINLNCIQCIPIS